MAVRARVQTVVAGAGVVGLATARALALSGREVLVLEAEQTHGSVTSSRNSEVIHAGVYYPPDSLKARACVEGRRMLYDYCAARGINHLRCGKLIVASSQEQLGMLSSIQARAEGNGVTGEDALRCISREEAVALQPELDCTGALLSPSTGIVDSHELMLALLGDAEAHGAMVAFDSRVLGGLVSSDGRIVVRTADTELECAEFINCAGLSAPQLARRLLGMPSEQIPALRFAKGNYYSLQGRSPFQMLVYPVPEEAGLGVHATIDLGGQCRFGPDVEWVEPRADGSFDYSVDPRRADGFYAEVRKYWPALPDNALVPDYAGIRPKLAQSGSAVMLDFIVQGPNVTRHPGLLNFFGIESPGLTSALSLGAQAVRLLDAA